MEEKGAVSYFFERKLSKNRMLHLFLSSVLSDVNTSSHENKESDGRGWGISDADGGRQTREEDERRGVSVLSAGGELYRFTLCPNVTL